MPGVCKGGELQSLHSIDLPALNHLSYVSSTSTQESLMTSASKSMQK